MVWKALRKSKKIATPKTVFVCDLDSITHLLIMLEKFAFISGLQINTSKTEALWLGLWKDRQDTLSISIIHKILFVH